MSLDQTMKILLVEDSRTSRKMQKKALHDLGFTNTVEAEHGDDAIAKLEQEKDVQLIISDWNMPVKDGYELLVWVRSHESFKNVPFIMATARGEKKEAAKATEAGVSNFITKPFGPDELKKLIEETFKPKKEGAGAAIAPYTPKKGASGKLLLNVAHIQITDHLTLGVMKNMIETGKLMPQYFELQTTCMPSWNALQGALEKGEVDACFILAPIAMDLFAYGVPIKLILFAHKNGSICVRKAVGENKESLQKFFRDKTFYIPHEMSIHHMLAHIFLRQMGLKPGFYGRGDYDVFFEVVPPVKMPEFMAANPDVAGYLVAEPLGTKAIAEGIADLLFLSGELWEKHPCCVVTVRDEILGHYGEAIQEFTNMVVEAGKFIEEKPETAAEIGVAFLDPNKTLNLKVPVLKNVLKELQGIKTRDLFPVKEDLDRIQRYMVENIGIGTMIDLNKFVDTSFAKVACKDFVSTAHPISISQISEVASSIVNRKGSGLQAKTMLNMEGKYLIFSLKNQEFGIDILWVKEIVGMRSIRTMPHAPHSVRGIINLRGRVIPVVDLRNKLGMESNENEERSRIIVLESDRSAEATSMGIMVDEVSDVVNVKAEHIDDASSFKVDTESSYIMAMANLNGGIKILLNTQQLFH